MNTDQAGHLDGNLQVVGDGVARVQAAVRAGLVRDLEPLVHLVGAQAGAVGREPGQPLVGGVARLVDDAHVKVGLLFVEERLAEGPELGGVQLHDGEGGLVHEGGRGVPGLDLLAEDDLQLAGELRVPSDPGGDRSHERVEDFWCRVSDRGR